MTEWRGIRDWPEYEVSDDGQVKRVMGGGSAAKIGKILRPGTNTYGYYFVVLYRKSGKKTGLISRLVCEAFNGPPPSPKHEAAHWNGIRTDKRGDLRRIAEDHGMTVWTAMKIIRQEKAKVKNGPA